MTTAQKISSMQNLKRNGILEPAELNDELNPKYLFSLTYSELLCAIVNGKIDAKELAWQQQMTGIWKATRNLKHDVEIVILTTV